MNHEFDPVGDPAAPLHERPADLLRELIRFNTTNPPGDERACVEWIQELLADAGFSTETYARDPDRPNLVARLEGGNRAPPLLLYGHVDVVPTEGQEWTHPPFEGHVEDDYVWGRGALDMKGGVAMYLASALRAAHEDLDLAGDLVVVILADEEAGGDDGARYMAEEHPEVFEGIDYALGEFGGFSMELAGQTLYPIQMNEKLVCWVQLTVRGPAGHASFPRYGTAMGDAGRAVAALDEARLPVHVVPTVEDMIRAIADEVGGAMGDSLRDLLDPDQTDAILDTLGDDGETFDALLHNTANPTVVRGGDKENVIPGEVEITVDCRLLPGQTEADVRRQIRDVIPDDVDYEFEVLRFDPFPAETDRDLFDLLADTIEDGDPEGTAVPFVLPGGTDARHFARCGVQSYGFTPMKLPPEFDFQATVHAADERIPIDAVEFGTDRVYEVLRRYDETTIGE